MTLFEIALIGYYLVYMLIQFYSSMEIFDKTVVLPTYSGVVQQLGYTICYAVLLIMALLWPITVPFANLYSIFKNKKNEKETH